MLLLPVVGFDQSCMQLLDSAFKNHLYRNYVNCKSITYIYLLIQKLQNVYLIVNVCVFC